MGKKKARPADWRVVVERIEGDATLKEIAETFGVSVQVLGRWRKDCRELNDEVLKHVRAPTRQKISEAGELTPDEIDDLVLASGVAEVPVHARRLMRDLRQAIRQLRKEKRQVMSELNRVQHTQMLKNI